MAKYNKEDVFKTGKGMGCKVHTASVYRHIGNSEKRCYYYGTARKSIVQLPGEKALGLS